MEVHFSPQQCWRHFLTIAFLMLCTIAIAQNQATTRPFLHPLFCDNMVLQRDIADPIWGWTDPGKSVSVTMLGKTVNTKADAEGKWMAKIGPFQAGGPYTLTISGPQGMTLNNVMVGDVWLCSGQSNMEFSITSTANAAEEIANANYPNIRLYTVQKTIAFQPTETVSGQWFACNPTTVVKSGGFSAVAYFFGRLLNTELNVPIGLIHASWGGTPAEAWTSEKALLTMPDFKAGIDKVHAHIALLQSGQNDDTANMDAWYKQNDPDSANGVGLADPATPTTDWKTMRLPQQWENVLPNFDGIVWFRKEIDIPEDWAGKDAVLHLSTIDDYDTTWVNGTMVGQTYQWSTSRDYKVPAALLKPGRNVIAVRVLDMSGFGGLYGRANQMKLDVVGTAQTPSIALAGDWLYHVGPAMNRMATVPRPMATNPKNTTVLYNGMIAPLVPFGIKGVIWYQGEDNAGRGKQYQTLLPTMIHDWRSRFGVGEFPFLIVQLANLGKAPIQPSESAWAELREAQLLTAKNVPSAGMAVTIDIGNPENVHPTNKQDVGRRLGLAALGIAYNQKIEYSGPIYQSMTVNGNAIRVKFDHIGGGLVAKDGLKLTGFAIAGADKKFVWADANIDGDSVVVSSPEVAQPIAVRYAWADNPICNLYNKDGLPASPFRTDTPK